ncbi:hypothetical protein TTHERM_01054250 (macronuclear) [Tetrahymena thermophila SB210]|uniref:WW domain protein n=1 Tax=Tetrahymena thermophila (strain SB210) TaxID=312017 RepID=Q22CC6_TETTS|nr:hypothetical protein TTHERM_01054250 [Tetrahymena thermophila SB210]EAR82940.2 hypothetical protein TTHERM_01054250 [Tetrahymena thermophila SB210]|eukprot:XP_001030603.2 hypothetical protein TTHERM_01054250 [Tetrahymena thermophila SB210]
MWNKNQNQKKGMMGMNQYQQQQYYQDPYQDPYEEEWIRYDEELEEDYEPNEEEVLNYAQYLGMDLDKDKKYFYIAREGLKAPLPEQWHVYQHKYDDQRFYLNSVTGEKQLEHPCDQFYKKKFEEMKMKDQQKQVMYKNQDIQDMNEGFVGDSRVLDSSMNQSFNQNFLLNPDYQDVDEQTQMKLTVEREIQQEYQDYEGQLLQQYKQKNIDFENIRKKEGKEIDKQIEKDLKEIKKQVKQAEDDQLKRLNAEKKQTKKNLESQMQEELKSQLKGLEEQNDQNKKKVNQDENDWVEKQGKKYQNELQEEFEIKNRALDRKRNERSDAQKKHDEKFKEAKQRVSIQLNDFKSKIIKEQTDHLNQLENEQFDNKRDTQESFQSQLDSEYLQKKSSNEEIINKMRNELKNLKNKIQKDYEDKYTTQKTEIAKQNEIRLQKLKNENDFGKIDNNLNKIFELERQKQLSQLQTYISSDKNELELKEQKMQFNLNREIKEKYDHLKETLQQDGLQKIKKIKEELKLNVDIDDKDFDLICQKQELQNKIEHLKNDLDKLKQEKDKQFISLNQLQDTQKDLVSEYSDTLQRNKLLLLSNDLTDLDKKVEKLIQSLYEKEQLAKKLEEQQFDKKQSLHQKRKDNIKFQKDIILLKEQQKLQKVENINSQIKYEELLSQIGNLKQTINEKLEQQQSILQVDESKIVKQANAQDITEKPNKSNIIQNESNKSNNNNISQKPKNQIKRRPSSSSNEANQKKRAWFNRLIQERNILTQMKTKLKNKKIFIQQTQDLIDNEQQKLNEELNKQENIINQSQIKKSIFKNLQQNMLQHTEKLNQEVNLYRQLEINYQIKDKQLQQMEQLYDEILQDGTRQFNEETFVQLYKVYQSLDTGQQEDKLDQSVINNNDIQGENQIHGQINTNQSDFNWKMLINYPNSTIIQNNQNQINEQDELVMDRTTISINNQNNNTQMNQNFQNISNINTNSQNFDLKSALVTLKNRYSQTPQFSNNLTDMQNRSTMPFESRLMSQIKKKNTEGYNSSFIQINNWMQNMKDTLNSQILDGPFASHKLKTII